MIVVKCIRGMLYSVCSLVLAIHTPMALLGQNTPVKDSLSKAPAVADSVKQVEADKKPEASKEKKKPETKYSKLFKDKKVETVKGGLLTLHKMDGKLYLELPTKYLGRDMLMGATISATSDPTYLSVGTRASQPLYTRLERQDSSIVLKKPNTMILREGVSPEVARSLASNYQDPSLKGLKIEAYTPDSTALVLDVTSLLAKPNDLVSAIPEFSQGISLSGTPISEINFIKGMKVFDDNASITVQQGYKVTASIMGMIFFARNTPTTVDVTYSLQLLPEGAKMIPRVVDTRVGVNYVEKYNLNERADKSERIYLAQRWNLVPQDKKAYAAGKRTAPIKPIVFYVDPNFPVGWYEAIKQGVLAWQPAFERAGFRGAIQVKPYPKDKNFDAENISYSCIRYAPSTGTSITSSKWVHPETGEILSASITIPNNIRTVLHTARFVQTAAVDSRVRSGILSEELFRESLSMAVMQAIGATLGYTMNAGGTSAISTEAIRAGREAISNSVLDGTLYNYIAGSASPNLVMNKLGAYDYFVTEWAYRYYPQYEGKREAQSSALEAFVDGKVRDPRYRYAPRQVFAYDPTAIYDDLGDDIFKTTKYAYANLATIQKNLFSWIKNDEDSRIKSALTLAVAQQYHALHKHVANYVGGAKVQAAKESSGVARFSVIPKEKQREALLWTINNIKHFDSFANRASERRSPMAVSYFDQLLEYLTMDLFNLRARVIQTAHLTPKGQPAYTLSNFFDDLYQGIFASTIKGGSLTTGEVLMQRAFVNQAFAIATGGADKATPRLPMALQLTDRDLTPASYELYTEALRGQEGFGDPQASIYPSVNIRNLDNSPLYYYSALLKLKPLLEQRIASTKQVELLAHYQVLLKTVTKALDNK